MNIDLYLTVSMDIMSKNSLKRILFILVFTIWRLLVLITRNLARGRVKKLNRKELSCSASEFNTTGSQYIHSLLSEIFGAKFFRIQNCTGHLENLTQSIYCCSYYIPPQADLGSTLIKHISAEKWVDNHTQWNKIGL